MFLQEEILLNLHYTRKRNKERKKKGAWKFSDGIIQIYGV